ncbi:MULTISPECIES: FMN-binding protein [unclassified Ruminococcus]|uniref:FMN-binding protein n=1 Tax=unclassified Ruminococcus TaxID=2608920 RepID=UPI00210C4388|nr:MULTISPECIES: FMN-binding protein [unclassified Ruminococcus]
MKKKILAVILSAALIGAVIFGILYLKQVSDYKDNIASITFAAIDLTAVSDGTYIGKYDAGMISAKVQVTVEDHAIREIKLLEHKNDRGAPAESILDHMVQEQKTDVDAVTGATNSSKVLRKAVENALAMGMEDASGS